MVQTLTFHDLDNASPMFVRMIQEIEPIFDRLYADLYSYVQPAAPSGFHTLVLDI